MKESEILKQITDWLTAKRIFHFRLGTGSFFGKHKGKSWAFKAHSLGPGAADIFVLEEWKRYFTPIWIECKTEKGKQSSEQKSFQQYVESLGHRYVVARSIDDLKKMTFIRERVGGETP